MTNGPEEGIVKTGQFVGSFMPAVSKNPARLSCFTRVNDFVGGEPELKSSRGPSQEGPLELRAVTCSWRLPSSLLGFQFRVEDGPALLIAKGQQTLPQIGV